MKVNKKREMIEVLLCAAGNPFSIISDACKPGSPTYKMATRLREQAIDQTLEFDYDGSCMEAAYLLIESSPTLCREWFGAA